MLNWEFFAVAVCSLTIGAGIAVLQVPYASGSTAKFPVTGFEDFGSVTPIWAAYFGGPAGFFVGLLVYGTFLRNRLTVAMACKVVMCSLAVGIVGGYFFSLSSVAFTPLAAITIARWSARHREETPGSALAGAFGLFGLFALCLALTVQPADPRRMDEVSILTRGLTASQGWAVACSLAAVAAGMFLRRKWAALVFSLLLLVWGIWLLIEPLLAVPRPPHLWLVQIFNTVLGLLLLCPLVITFRCWHALKWRGRWGI